MSWAEWKYELRDAAEAVWAFIVAHRTVVLALVVGFALGAWAC